MHLFFDTVWKLHIGEIPEKPHEFIDEIEQYDIWEEYRNKIAAIKQNALTVWNPEACQSLVFYEKSIWENGVKPGEFYFWPGGADILEKIPPIAILTLPEEKRSLLSIQWRL